MSEEQVDRPLRFDGRVAIVTGSGGIGGLGREIAVGLAQRGAKVVINGRRRGMVDDTVQEIRRGGWEAVPCYGCVTDRAVAENLVRTAVDTFGAVDIVVNNAAVLGTTATSMNEISDAEYQDIMDVNVHGIWLVIQAAWPGMQERKHGRVVNLVSQAILGDPERVLYAASKGAVVSMSRSLALAGKEHGILVNCVSPLACTEGVESAFNDGCSERLDFIRKNLPVTAAAQVPIWLCHESVQVTGEVLISGGGVIKRLFMAETRGVGLPKFHFTAEIVQAHLDEWHNEVSYLTPQSTTESVSHLISSLARN